ncbi:MAG TPA: hypothetical protein VNU25_00805 [Candidatus Paceibacterota bacterium]|nr:hypothetical protein [Candidatus Paceibacterota bacterium]
MKTALPFKDLLKRFSYGNRPRPSRDWFMILSIATCLIVLSVGWNLWLLRSVEQGGVIGNEAPAASFDARPIEEIRAVFESRSLEELQFRQQYRFVDPSL